MVNPKDNLEEERRAHVAIEVEPRHLGKWRRSLLHKTSLEEGARRLATLLGQGYQC